MYSNGDLLCSFCRYGYFAKGFGLDLPLKGLFCLGVCIVGGGYPARYGAGGANTPLEAEGMFMGPVVLEWLFGWLGGKFEYEVVVVAESDCRYFGSVPKGRDGVDRWRKVC